MTTLEKIGCVIKTLRFESGLSQDAFCNQCKIDQHYISNIENGQRNLSIAFVERISHFFGLSLSQFFLKVESVETKQLKSALAKTVISSLLDEFVDFMIQQGLKPRTYKKYSFDVPNCAGVKDIIKKLSGVTDDMYHIKDIDLLTKIIEQVSDSVFDQVGNNMYSCGLKKYKKFLESIE